jgi:hypothetical protein
MDETPSSEILVHVILVMIFIDKGHVLLTIVIDNRRGRTLAFKIMRSAACVVLLSLALAWPAVANTISVNDPADTTGGRGCTLRDALAAANTDTAQGGCAAGNGADTIQFDLTLPARITLKSNTELTISTDATILGPGATLLTIDGNARRGGTRVLEITAGTANISDLAIKNGNAGAGNGGGVLVDAGAALNLRNCTLMHNVAASGGGVFNSNGTVIISNCAVRHNRAKDDVFGTGGGIDNDGTSAVLNAISCTVVDNAAARGDGGIGNYGGSATVSNSTLSNNTGDGLGNSGSATLSNCTIQANRGGGIINGAPEATASVLNCTVSGNRGSLDRGGIANYGSLVLGNTIIAHSRRHGGDCFNDPDGFTSVTDLGHNLIDDPVANCGLTNGSNGDIVGVDAGLLRLANNGSSTKTMALCTGAGMPRSSCRTASPAVNAGDNSICQGPFVNNVDERGHLRVTATDTVCDIGAYEAP